VLSALNFELLRDFGAVLDQVAGGDARGAAGDWAGDRLFAANKRRRQAAANLELWVTGVSWNSDARINETSPTRENMNSGAPQ
jgi:hypothetical protein